MGLKRVSWVRRYQGQCRALRPLGHQGCRLRNHKKDQPLCSGYRLLWGLHSTAGAALACGPSCEARTALLVRPWRGGVHVGPAQHCWCGPGVRGCLWGLHRTAGAALACWGRGGGGAGVRE